MSYEQHVGLHQWYPRWDEEINAFDIDQGTLERGWRYAQEGRVSTMVWDPALKMLRGTVRGSKDQTYNTMVKLVPGTLDTPQSKLAPPADGIERPRWTLTVGLCSCPVATDCKHCVALMYSGLNNEKVVNALERDFSLELTSTANRLPARALNWERSLGDLIGSDLQREPRTPIALGFEIQDTAQASLGRLRPENSTPAPPSIRIRPVSMGTRGKWVRSQVAWDKLRFLNYRHEYNARQLAWLIDFESRFQRNSRFVQSYAQGWMDLALFDSPSLWTLLAEAKDLGLPLVSLQPDLELEVSAQPGELTLDLTESTHRGADLLDIHTSIAFDNQLIDTAQVVLIGEPAHGFARLSEDPSGQSTLLLAPLNKPLQHTTQNFVKRGEKIAIPSGDRDKFMNEYVPQLRQNLNVISSDSTVSIPEYHPPKLHILVEYTPPHQATITFEWVYQLGAQTRRTPLYRSSARADAFRDTAAEKHTLASLGRPWTLYPELGAETPGGQIRLNQHAVLHGLSTARFTLGLLPQWRTLDHVDLQIRGEVADYTEVTEEPVIEVATRESVLPEGESKLGSQTSRDWFDLEIQVRVRNEIVTVGQIVSHLARGNTQLLLPSGTFFSLDTPQFDELRRLVLEAQAMQESKSESLRISRFQMGFWDELSGLSVVTEQASRWREALAGVEDDGVPPALPAGLTATLRPYQVQGFEWLAFLFKNRLGAILADDMGLGKTVQTLALIQHVYERSRSEGAEPKPVLVVAPTSVVSNWASEIAKFTPQLRVHTITETLRKSKTEVEALTAGADVVITSYALLRIDEDAYRAHEWAMLILDEAQFVKNRASKAHQAARMVPADFKLAITGTPMENNLMELFSLMAIVAPGLFPNAKRFAEFFQKPIERERNAKRLATLRTRLAPLMLRRTKEQVILDLPTKQEQVLEIELNPAHEKVYRTHLQRERVKVLGLLADMDKNRFTVLSSLTRLRQLSLDPSLVDPELSSVSSSKLDALMEQLPEVLAEGHKALIFSQFTGFLGKLRERLDAAGLDYAYLDGTTRDRSRVIDEFKNGDKPLFLISLKAGGFGLNLTEADYVYVLDPWWNPASEAQAVDRTHRIGQDKPVMVYRMVARGTIEDKVMALKATKSQLFAEVMTGDLAQAHLSAEDLASLFE